MGSEIAPLGEGGNPAKIWCATRERWCPVLSDDFFLIHGSILIVQVKRGIVARKWLAMVWAQTSARSIRGYFLQAFKLTVLSLTPYLQ